jgi:hypothetical protein
MKLVLPSGLYYDGPGTRIITEARLAVGGQVISTLTGPYMDLQNDVNVPLENRAALTGLVGRSDTTVSQNII